MDAPLACITGVKDQQVLTAYQQDLEALAFGYCDIFLSHTSLLVAASVSTEKYKIWRFCKQRVRCVRVEWLQDSKAEGRVLPYEQYEIDSIFYNCCIGVYGFEGKPLEVIKSNICANGGRVVIVDNSDIKAVESRQLQSSEDSTKMDVVMVSKSSLSKLRRDCKSHINHVIARLLRTVPCVGVQWLETCLRDRYCKLPLDYSYNYQQIKTNKRQRQLARLKSENAKSIHTPLLSISNTSALPEEHILSQCLIYLHESIFPKTIDILKHSICINNGLYLQFLNPILTHIAVDALEIQQKQYLELMRYGSVSIVRVEWLIDSLLFKSRMHQGDYQIFGFWSQSEIEEGEKGETGKRTMKATYQHQQNRLKSSYSNSLSHPPQMFSSSSASTAERLPIKAIAVVKKKANRTEIFKDAVFIIINKVRKQKELKNIVTMIRENGGIAYDKPPKNCQIAYCILVDGSDVECNFEEVCQKYLQQGTSNEQKGETQELRIVPISYRWIQYCVKKQCLVPFNTPNHFTFKPFKFKTPLIAFLALKFEIVGVEPLMKMRLRELLDELGSKKARPSAEEITHCLCGPKVDPDCEKKDEQSMARQSVERIEQIRRVNNRIVFLKVEWIMECMNAGCMAPTDGYRLA